MAVNGNLEKEVMRKSIDCLKEIVLSVDHRLPIILQFFYYTHKKNPGHWEFL